MRPGASAASIFRLNRRAYPRHVLVRRSCTVHVADGSRHPCVVLNISAGGLLARTYRPSVPGERVRIELVPGETFAGSVLWAQDWSIGIAFDDLIEVEGLLTRQWVGEAVRDRRRSPRHFIACPASLRVNKRFHYGRICDISSGGARFCVTKPLKKTGPAVLTLPDLPPLRSAIAWMGEQICGLVFDEEIPQEALSRWLSSRESGAE